MTTVAFRLGEASLAEDVQHSPERANPAALEEACFVMPGRLSVNGVELIAQPSRAQRNALVGAAEQRVQQIQLPNDASRWLPLPLPGFATQALQALNELKPGREQELNLAGGGHLVLTRQNDQISIKSSINGKQCSTQFAEALTAFRAFSGQVRQMLVARAAAMRRHASWKQWFA